MDKSPVSYRSILLAIIFSSVMLFLIGFRDIFYHKTRVVFCDVGQGDAAYIRTRKKQDILIDAGPDGRVLSCLGKYMPFYDRKIELAFLSHPQKDHYGGYLEVVERYQIDNFIVSALNNNNQSFNLLKTKLRKKKTKIKNVYAGEKIMLEKNSLPSQMLSRANSKEENIEFLWPKRQFMAENTICKEGICPVFTNNNVLGAFAATTDLNDFSSVFLFSQGNFNVLFTGDASPKVLNSLVGTIDESSRDNIDIFKIPHHGSKNGLTKEFLILADPKLSVISVGKNNSYGHPATEILEMLKALKKKYLRTDEKGDIVVEVEERGWRVK